MFTEKPFLKNEEIGTGAIEKETMRSIEGRTKEKYGNRQEEKSRRT